MGGWVYLNVYIALRNEFGQRICDFMCVYVALLVVCRSRVCVCVCVCVVSVFVSICMHAYHCGLSVGYVYVYMCMFIVLWSRNCI